MKRRNTRTQVATWQSLGLGARRESMKRFGLKSYLFRIPKLVVFKNKCSLNSINGRYQLSIIARNTSLGFVKLQMWKVSLMSVSQFKFRVVT